MSQPLDVTGIGNAIVDVLAQASDAQLDQLALPKGSMTLIDASAADRLYGVMAPAVEISGGSVANSMAGIASLGGKAAYVGKVKADQLGQVFTHDIRAAGVEFSSKSGENCASTARCLILVTPDGQRTMSTYLGACVELGPEDIDEALIARSKVTYLEGYLWDPPRAKEAMLKAANLAHKHGGRVALSLSDAFCVGRHRQEFSRLIEDHVDILFANEAEIQALTETSDFESALAAVRGRCEVSVLTRGADGAVVLANDERFVITAEPVEQVVDTTGAGDLFAAGFLYGFTNGYGPGDAARIGSICAAEVISHVGARPAQSLAKLIAERGVG
ncbi:MAG: putative carbohydrate/purine kinase [Myxococcaceae bacterium]|nr:putative carbohydrate/purine kinase [Myxococcaceae bacterium]